MPRFRVRYRGTFYELPRGEFVVGRAPGCQLTVDDPRVSRRHASFRVEAQRLTVEDLRSRNGTLVNGVLLRNPQVLANNDVVTVGSQELRVVATREDEESLARSIAATAPSLDPGGLPDDTVNGSSLLLLIDKAHRMGSSDEAETILRQFYGEADGDGTPSSTRLQSAAVMETVARITIAHVGVTSRGSYIDQLFALYRRAGVVMPAFIVDEVHALVRRLKHPLSPELREYAEWLRDEADRLGPAERFALQRVEGLVRMLRGQPE